MTVREWVQKTMDFKKIPVVGRGVTLTEIPDHIAVYFEIGGCYQNCPGCHSPHHKLEGVLSSIDCLVSYTEDQKEKGANAVVLMGGTTSKYLNKHELSNIIQTLSKILPVGLYSGDSRDDFFMNNKNLRWYKYGSYVESLGGLTSTTTNQKFYQRSKCGEWELINELYTSTTQPEKHLDI